MVLNVIFVLNFRIPQDKNGATYMVTSDGSDVVQHNGGVQAHTQYIQEAPVSNGHDSSMIRIVGIQDKRPGGSVVKVGQQKMFLRRRKSWRLQMMVVMLVFDESIGS